MRSHLGVLAFEKPGTPQPSTASREGRTPGKDDNLHDTIPDLRANPPSLRTPYETISTTESTWVEDTPASTEESDQVPPKPEKLPPINWRAVLRHASVILAIPLFPFVMATLYSRGLFKSSEPPGTWLLMVRQYADQDWCFHAIVLLFFIAAILMVGKKLTYGFYVLSVAWSVLFIRNL